MPYKDREKQRAYAKSAAHKRAMATWYQRKKQSLKQQRAAHNAAYHQTHKQKIAARKKARREDHIETARARERTYNRKHPEVRNAYRRAHPEYGQMANQQRRQYIKHAPLNDFTAKQWREMKAAYGSRCVYCGRKMQRLTMDHLTPLSKGGSHTRSNIVPACMSCNSRKHTGPPLIPVQPLLL